MSNNKQSSSIDFFWNQLPEILPFTVDTETAVKLWEAFQQSKAMHYKEIVTAYSTALPIEDGVFTAIDKGHKYYDKTFNNNEQQ